MEVVIQNPKLKNRYNVPSSKSMVIRALFLNYLNGNPLKIVYNSGADDISVMEEALSKLSEIYDPAHDALTDFGKGFSSENPFAIDCKDSATVFRFLEVLAEERTLPIALTGSDRLLERISMALPTSQRESAKMMVLGESKRPKVSQGYYDLTRYVIDDYMRTLRSGEKEYVVEGDWSCGACWFTASALTKGNTNVEPLDPESPQPDSIILPYFHLYAENLEGDSPVVIDGAESPDLVPLLAVMFATRNGFTIIENIGYLKGKESDRIQNTVDMLHSLGIQAGCTDDSITIFGKARKYPGGVVDPKGDHRIAMAGAIGAFCCDGPVTIIGAECVDKSYENFWEELL